LALDDHEKMPSKQKSLELKLFDISPRDFCLEGFLSCSTFCQSCTWFFVFFYVQEGGQRC